MCSGFRSSCLEVFSNKGVLRNFSKCIGKYLCNFLWANFFWIAFSRRPVKSYFWSFWSKSMHCRKMPKVLSWPKKVYASTTSTTLPFACCSQFIQTDIVIPSRIIVNPRYFSNETLNLQNNLPQNLINMQPRVYAPPKYVTNLTFKIQNTSLHPLPP